MPRSKFTLSIATTVTSTVAPMRPTANLFVSTAVRPAMNNSQTPSAMSITPPEMSRTFSPSSGISTSAASPAPTIEPSVLTLYTAPTARSPLPAFNSIRVMSGSVIPAQNVAGSITASAMPYFATVKSW